ncbi:MAG TPA: SAM-dependent methyltransferase [Paraburkholderia sp.]
MTMLRALGHAEPDSAVRCGDALAQRFLDDDTRMLLRMRRAMLSRFETTAPGLYGYVVARTRFFDEVVARGIDAGVRQLVLIGSGYDSRAWRFEAPVPLTFYEVDISDVHRSKAERAAAAGLAAPANRIVPIDAQLDAGGLVARLDAAGLDWREPLTVLAEGVLYYLEPTFFDGLLDALRARRGSRGASVAFDYLDGAVLANPEAFHGGEQVQRMERDEGVTFRFCASRDAIHRRCAERGLVVTRDHDAADIERRYLTRTDGMTASRTVGGFHLCDARFE